MFTLNNLLLLAHILGLALGVGSATIKIILLLRTSSQPDFFQTYFKVAKPITQMLVTGLILLTLSGIAWLILGYPFSTILVIKLVFVGIVWILGPIIDNNVEPKVKNMVFTSGETISTGFIKAKKQYLALELTATLLMYLITILGVLL